MKVQVYHDGKGSRNVDAVILKRQAGRVLISFKDITDEDVMCWFRKRRRDNGGVYESEYYNYWYYRGES